jgi:regulator of sirC expression with transglutaminase-like and TPR domain
MILSDIQARLEQIGTRNDEDVPIAESLLLIGSMNTDEIDLDPYRAHIKELHRALDLEIEKHPIGDQPVLEYRMQRLNTVLIDQYGYTGDTNEDNYDDPDKINLLDVIDRRCGISVALGVLYIELALKQRWAITGLNFPGHFLMRLEDGTHRRIFDPFYPNEEMDAGKLRQLLKTVLGPRAELNHEYYNPVTRREVILRFCNNRKTRLITQEDYARAMQMVTQELWVAPHEPRLYFDAGMISIRSERFAQAIAYLQKFIQISSDTKTISEAQTMIRALQRRLT